MKIDRLIGIVTILLQTEKSTVPALAQRFEVSRRTIERDIDALCRAGVPLVTVQGYGGGVFIEPRYKLDKTLLSGPELAALVAGAAGVGSVSPAPLARSLAEKLGGSGTDDLLIDLSSHYRESLTPKIELLRTAIAEHAVCASPITMPKALQKNVRSPTASYFSGETGTCSAGVRTRQAGACTSLTA